MSDEPRTHHTRTYYVYNGTHHKHAYYVHTPRRFANEYVIYERPADALAPSGAVERISRERAVAMGRDAGAAATDKYVSVSPCPACGGGRLRYIAKLHPGSALAARINQAEVGF